MSALQERRDALLAKLRPKEQDYLLGYYEGQEHQFIHAYTKRLPNLGVESTQMAESSHGPIKTVTNRHTPISDSLKQICTHIEIMQSKLESETNHQRASLPKLMDRKGFRTLALLMTHAVIDLILFEFDLVKKWVEEVSLAISKDPAPKGEGCGLDCELPLRYGLPCRCWLYLCIKLDVPLLISLVHPRWFFDKPAKVAPEWVMTFDLDITFQIMKDRVQQSIQELPLKYDTNNTPEEQENEPSILAIMPESLLRNLDCHAGDRYQRKGIDLVESAIRNAIAFQKSLPNLQRAEEFAREYAQLTENFQVCA